MNSLAAIGCQLVGLVENLLELLFSRFAIQGEFSLETVRLCPDRRNVHEIMVRVHAMGVFEKGIKRILDIIGSAIGASQFMCSV